MVEIKALSKFKQLVINIRVYLPASSRAPANNDYHHHNLALAYLFSQQKGSKNH